jgi:5'-methylthioadenosine phosphorylase
VNNKKIIADIGIIGGSGMYDQTLFKNVREVKLSTPYGETSSLIEVGDFVGKKVAFIPRHGKHHTIPPHEINYRANIWAMKELGVTRIISPCAVGSLKKEYKPGEIVVVDQFVDFTKKREYTFYDSGKAMHISTADPFCKELRDIFYREAKKLKIPVHNGTYICIEGPRFSTRAESKMFRNFADIIGMTLVPEAQLARELEICYVSLAMITDYDVWMEKPVDAREVVETMRANTENVKKLLKGGIEKIPAKRTCECKYALRFAAI